MNVRDELNPDIPVEDRVQKHAVAASGAQREKLETLPYDLVPFQEITDAFVRVAEFGAVKYAPWNWSKGLARVQLCCSLLRHTFAYIRGQDRDPESGLMHTDHILWNASVLAHNVHHNLEDGRRGEPPREYHDMMQEPWPGAADDVRLPTPDKEYRG